MPRARSSFKEPVEMTEVCRVQKKRFKVKLDSLSKSPASWESARLSVDSFLTAFPSSNGSSLSYSNSVSTAKICILVSCIAPKQKKKTTECGNIIWYLTGQAPTCINDRLHFKYWIKIHTIIKFSNNFFGPLSANIRSMRKENVGILSE